VKRAEILPRSGLKSFTPDQERAADACARVVARGGAVLVRGYAGTGKSEFIASLVESLEDARLNYAAVCPTGKAAATLRAKGAEAQTIHAFGYIPQVDPRTKELLGFRRKLDMDLPAQFVLIVDEASMVGPTVLHDLLDLVHPGTMRRALILVGDGFQLPPVLSIREQRDFGADFDPLSPAMYAETGTELVEMTGVVRQAAGNPLLATATALRTPGAMAPMPDWDHLSVRRVGRDWAETLLVAGGLGNAFMLTWTNRDRKVLNACAREGRGYKDTVCPSDELIVLANHKPTGLCNGDDLTVMDVLGSQNAGGVEVWNLVVRSSYSDTPFSASVIMDFGKRSFAAARVVAKEHGDVFGLPLVADYGYCRTVHKAQGSERDTVYVYAPGGLIPVMGETAAKRWLYTAITRAKNDAHFGGDGTVAYMLGG